MKFTSFCKTLGSFKLFLILLIALLIAPRGQAATYYVSTSGNDSNPGSLSLPWRTIGKAANTLVAGDTVNIRGGTYNEQVTPKNSGSQGAFIVYTAYPGETVTIDASGLGFSWSGIFNINSRSYIQVSGLRLVNSPGYGVYIMSSNNIRILNNYTYKTIYSGIGAYNSDTLTIDGNEIALANNGGGSQESLSIVTTQHYTVSHNRVHGGGKEGIDAKVGSSNGKIFGNVVYDMARVGIYVDAWDSTTNNIEIYNNVVSDSKTADSGSSQDGIRVGGERGGTASNIKIYNNVIYNIVWTGIIVANYHESGYSEPKFDTISIYNNTIYNTGTRSGGGVLVQGSQNKGVTIYNNIISKARSFNIQASLATINNNLFDGGSSSGSAAIMGSPLFVNAGSDFHLQAGSPAINAGSATGAPLIDFNMNSRPQGGAFDIGAFEYGSSAAPAPTPNPTPNPTSNPTPTPAPTTAPVSLPDVVVTSVSYSNGIFTSVVKNQGAGATPSGVVIGVGYFVDGVYRTWGVVNGPLAAGASVTIQTNGGAYIIPSGSHTIGAFVDDSNRFAESNKNNNTLTQSITVNSLPDVIVTSVSYSNGIFTSVVKNQGAGATPSGVVIGVGYFVDGVYRTWGVVNGPLAAGASVTIQTNGGAYLIPSGSHTIGAFVDDSNRFAESNKNNNTLTQSITVNSLPDVIVTSVSYSNGIFTSVVKNQGTGATPSGIVIGVGYFVDGVYRTWGVVDGPLAAGASVTIKTNGGAYFIPSGSHTIGAFVDDSQRFTESNENNNKLSRTIWVP